MSNPQPLFRSSALQARRAESLGRILLSAPPPLRMLGAAAVLIAVALIAFVSLGAFTSHVTLHGQLVPDPGLVQMPSPQDGVVVARRVRQGDRVRRGDVLMVLSGERWSERQAETHDSLAALMDVRRETLQGQLRRLYSLEDRERDSLQSDKALVMEEQVLLEEALALQRQRVDLQSSVLADLQRLLAAGHVSAEQERAVRDQLIEQQAYTRALEREYLAAEQRRNRLAQDLAALPLRYATQRAELDLALVAVDQEQVENDWRRRFAIVAPVDGVVVAVTADVGMVVGAQRPLLSMVPVGATLQAHLQAPETVLGSIARGDRLRLRFDAFPYQRFGHHGARVSEIDGAPLPVAADTLEPVYRIIAELEAQQIVARGRSVTLQPGMRVEARVALERRRLLAWVFSALR